jgi:hypothetical protein
MSENLERYLNYHLAGSVGAIRLIQHLSEAMDEPASRDYFVSLKAAVEEDQALLKQLVDGLGHVKGRPMLIAADITSRIGDLKLMWDGFESGQLGLLEGLEMLALGIQGKRLLWRALKEISCWYPEWGDVDFSHLEKRAVHQRDGVERWRIAAVSETLPGRDRRLAAKGIHDPDPVIP